MKNVFSLFGFATLLMFSFAFTPVETSVDETIEVCEEVCESYETTTVSTAELFGLGSFSACAISAGPTTVTYRLHHQGGQPSIQLTATCMPATLNLAFGEWDLYAVADQQAYAFFRWDFCNGAAAGQIGEFLDVPGTAEYITQIFIPCP